MRGLGRHEMTPEQRARLLSDKSKTTVEVRLIKFSMLIQKTFFHYLYSFPVLCHSLMRGRSQIMWYPDIMLCKEPLKKKKYKKNMYFWNPVFVECLYPTMCYQCANQNLEHILSFYTKWLQRCMANRKLIPRPTLP